MRVTKKNGRFVVEDAPMALEGKAAESFVAALHATDSAGRAPERERFLADCNRAYVKAKRQGA